jgi:hypothetical protein
VKLRKRTCKVCGEHCRVWSAVQARMREVDLYEALSEKTGRAIIVDSTKSVPWIDEQVAMLRELGVALHLFFVGRDGRAVLASSLRKRGETSARDHAAAWVAQIEATEALARRFPGPVTRLHYEALATQPDPIIDAISRALGIESVAAMRDPWTSEQHPLGGNAGTQSLLEGARTAATGDIAIGGDKRAYYAEHPRAFRLDSRWKTELTPDALRAFEEVAGATNRAYAWNEEEVSA